MNNINNFEKTNLEQKLLLVYIIILCSEKINVNDISVSSSSKELIVLVKNEIEKNVFCASESSLKIKANKYKYKLQSVCLENNLRIFKFLRYIYDNVYIYANIRDVIRYVFVICGNIKDPQQKYYLDFSSKNKKMILNLKKKLLTVGFDFKYKVSNQKHIIYITQSNVIEDFLTYIGASKSSLEIMNIKIYKNLRNKVNRIVNCETFNINKTISTASKQIQAIKNIISQKGIDYFDDNLKEIAIKRLENPEMSLAELLKTLSFDISKSGLNHRLKKIEKISLELNKE